MRKSSVIRAVSPLRSSGTLKSVRTRMRLPASDPRADSRSSRVGTLVISLLLAATQLLAGVEHEVDHPVGVAPLVVVPAEHLDELAHAHRQLAVEDARVRVAL